MLLHLRGIDECPHCSVELVDDLGRHVRRSGKPAPGRRFHVWVAELGEGGDILERRDTLAGCDGKWDDGPATHLFDPRSRRNERRRHMVSEQIDGEWTTPAIGDVDDVHHARLAPELLEAEM